MLHAARMLQKPVHWVSTRSEAFVTDNQGRDSFWSAELALNTRGRFLGLRVDCLGNVGAYFTGVAHFVFTTHISGCLPTVYDIPQAQVNYALRAHQHAADRALSRRRPAGGELSDGAADRRRRRQDRHRRRRTAPAQSDSSPTKFPTPPPSATPTTAATFPARSSARSTLGDYAGFAARKKAAKKQGRLRGIGIGCYLEIAGAFPEEAARITFPGGDKVTVSIGAGGSGQGHPTVFRKVAARRLGIAPEAVTVTSGDSARDVPGFGAVASRSAMYVGGAIAVTADKVIEKGKRVAAMLLQAGEGDVDYRDGKFSVNGSAREVSLFEVAERAAELARRA